MGLLRGSMMNGNFCHIYNLTLEINTCTVQPFLGSVSTKWDHSCSGSVVSVENTKITSSS